jgi:hypothetical protein
MSGGANLLSARVNRVSDDANAVSACPDILLGGGHGHGLPALGNAVSGNGD